MKPLCLLLMSAMIVSFAQQSADPWSPSEVVEPASLATALNSQDRPMVISVAFPVLYRQRHITGALDASAGSKPEGIEALRKLVSGAPKDADIVIYCGCCPMVKCPNVRPAFRVLKEMGYTKIRVLNIPENMSTDWYSKNYPSEPGSAAQKSTP